MSQQSSQFVYILYNDFSPYVYKIGWTSRDPKIRAEEISKGTGVVGNWKVAHFWHAQDGFWLEQRIFKKFDQYRLPRSEMFHFGGYTVEQIAEQISQFINDLGVSPKRAAEIEALRQKEARERYEQEKLERKQKENYERECHRLCVEIKSLVEQLIKNETPYFASPETKQAIKVQYMRYDHLPYNIEKLKQLKSQLEITAATKSQKDLSNSNANSFSKWVWFFVAIVVIGTIIFFAMISDTSDINSQPVENQQIQSNISTSIENDSNIPVKPEVQESQNETDKKPVLPNETPGWVSNYVEQSKSDEKAHYVAILNAHPDAREIVETRQFHNWINNQEVNLKSYYRYVLHQGTASEVISMLSDYKAATNMPKIEPVEIPTTIPADVSPKTVYEKYQEPILPKDSTLVTKPIEEMPIISN